MDVIIAIKLGISHTSNVCMINYNQPKDCEEFNVVFDTKSNTQLQTTSVTTPTVALFDDKEAIQSYGFEAEIQSKKLDNESNHLLFREFIWDLFCSDEKLPENLNAVNGRQMKSIDVMAAVLGYMISHIKTEAVFQGLPLTLKYVLTIPTCACKGSRTFMTEAALKAGCSSENIKIVEEAAAILLFCLHDKQHTGVTTLDDDTCNRKYIVVECEEDNAAISVLTYTNENMIGILYTDNAEIWKDGHILNDFIEIISLNTRKALLDFFEKYPMEYYNFLQEVKTKLRLTSSDCSKLYLNISSVMLEEKRCSESMQEAVLGTERKDELKFIGDKCVIKSERFQILFTEAGRRIVEYIEKELFDVFADINHIILVGEFAQSPILQDIIKTSFSAKNIIIPCEGNITAVRGAVLLGQRSISVGKKIVHTMNHTPLNNAQVVLTEGERIEINKKKSPRKRCVII